MATTGGGPLPPTSVAVITYERPDYLERCLTHLAALRTPPLEVIVVDSSDSDTSARLVRERFPDVRYLVNTAGPNTMATARNLAFQIARGDVVAFIDDDAYAEETWLDHLLPHYADPGVGAVGGRQIRRQEGELTEGVDEIGRFLEDGTLTGFFAADPGRPIEVDHLLGANMSYRRSVLVELGGIRDGYHGTCVREETDLCFRVKAAGYRLVFAPDAVVEHVAAPYAKGQRFDLRYAYWAQKNHVIVLVRNFGPRAGVLRRYLKASRRAATSDYRERMARTRSRASDGDTRGALVAGGAAQLRLLAVAAGTLTGYVAGSAMRRRV